jgi:hypothetical protein
VHIEEIVEIGTKTTEEAKTAARTMAAETRTSVNIAKHLATLRKIVGNYKLKKQQWKLIMKTNLMRTKMSKLEKKRSQSHLSTMLTHKQKNSKWFF